MEFLLATALGVITACGVFLLLRGRTFSVMLGLSLLGYAVNLFIFSMGRVLPGAPPVITEGTTIYTDPLPQALGADSHRHRLWHDRLLPRPRRACESRRRHRSCRRS